MYAVCFLLWTLHSSWYQACSLPPVAPIQNQYGHGFGTKSVNKLFLVEVALVIVFYHSYRNTKYSHKIILLVTQQILGTSLTYLLFGVPIFNTWICIGKIGLAHNSWCTIKTFKQYTLDMLGHMWQVLDCVFAKFWTANNKEAYSKSM